MGWHLQIWQQKANKLLNSSLFREPFHILTVTSLSLLLPLAFLLLARLSSYNYFLSVISDPARPPPCFLFSFRPYTSPAILYLLVSLISIATLVHGFTGKNSTLLNESPGPTYRPPLCIAWILLCSVQILVNVGIDGSMAAGIDGYKFGTDRSLLSRVIFFFGLHESMLHWSRTIVKPVVDDTIFGVARDERWAHRVAAASSLGTLWWWRLRDEVEALVIVGEAKREMAVEVGAADLVGWWLYYLTVTIGMVRVVKGLMYVGMVLLCMRVRRNNRRTSPLDDDDDGFPGDHDKV